MPTSAGSSTPPAAAAPPARRNRREPAPAAGRRLAAVREWLSAHGEFDGLLLIRQENLEDFDLRYVTAFTGSSGYAVVTADQALLLTDVRYLEQAARQCRGWRIERHGRPATKELAAALHGAGVRRLAFEPAGLTVALHNELHAGLPSVALHPAAGAVTALREHKDAAEVAAIARACAISDAAFGHLLPLIRPGISERDVARRLEELLYRHGADGVAFEAIAASGPNSALPHALPSARKIAPGDLITFDFGAAVAGYCADMTRTVVMGPASPRQRRLYEAVRRVQSGRSRRAARRGALQRNRRRRERRDQGRRLRRVPDPQPRPRRRSGDPRGPGIAPRQRRRPGARTRGDGGAGHLHSRLRRRADRGYGGDRGTRSARAHRHDAAADRAAGTALTARRLVLVHAVRRRFSAQPGGDSWRPPCARRCGRCRARRRRCAG